MTATPTRHPVAGAKLLWACDSETSAGAWRGLHDRLMGGRSRGEMQFKAAGTDSFGLPHTPEPWPCAVFAGDISLAHGGGFASIRHLLPAPVPVDKAHAVLLEVCGFGRPFKLALHAHPEADGVQHQATFHAPPQWVLLKLRLSDFKPTQRGRPLPLPGLGGTDHIHQLGLLTAERVAGGFTLGLRGIWLV